VRVVVRVNVPSGVHRLDVFQELGVHGHHVFDVAVNRAILDHPDFVVTLDDGRFDLAGFFLNDLPRVFAAFDDPLARFLDALGAERVGDAGPAQCGFGLLPRFLQGLVRPLKNWMALKAPLATNDNPFSTYLIGLCIVFLKRV
jgi:hypothetical protein